MRLRFQFTRSSTRSLALLLVPVSVLANAAVTAPTPPATFDTTYNHQSGSTIAVPAGGNLQAALNSAHAGDTIVLQAGASFNGPFTLPNTKGTGWVYVTSSAYANLPSPDSRVSPADAANMPNITGTSTGVTALQTASGAHQFRFVGVEFKPTPGSFLVNLITLGNGESSVATLPSDIIFDRCYIHGDPTIGGRRGVAMNGTRIAVINSYVADFKESGADSQALWAANTPGPLKVVNNYLEGAAENVLFGGADPTIKNVVPSDIEIRNNHFMKPLSWNNSNWVIKNLLEFKMAQRILVANNVFENVWAAAQAGFAIVITPRNQDGGAPWATVTDLIIVDNRIINAGQGFNISGTDDLHPSLRSERIQIKNNVMNVTGIGGANGRAYQVIEGPIDLQIDHNTTIISGGQNSALMLAENIPVSAERFAFTNNIGSKGSYGVAGSGTGDGTVALTKYFLNWSFTKNVIIGATASAYPPDNFFPTGVTAVNFVDAAGGNFQLAANSPYKNAGTDGKDLGADLNAVVAATTVANSGVPMAPTNFQIK